MKKLAVLLLFSSFFLISIDSEAQSFRGGMLGGVTFSQVNGDGYSGYNQVGGTVGGFVSLPLAKSTSLCMEMKYSLLGAHSSVKEVVEYYMNPFNLRLHYAEVPLMVRYDLSRFRVGNKSLDFIALEAGIGLDFLLGYRDRTADSENNNAGWLFFSMTGNVGIHFQIRDHWGVGLRSMNSFTPIRLKENGAWYGGNYYNIAIQIVMTYTIFSPRD